MALLFAGQSAHAATYTWANSNITATPPASLNWFAATQGTWTGDATTPVSGSGNTIRFFQDTSTNLTNTGPATQASVLDYGSPFELGTLTLQGKGNATAGRNLTMNISGDALWFSAATGTINTSVPYAASSVSYNVSNNIQLGTASTATALSIGGSSHGNNNYIFSGIISELQSGGGSLIKTGSSSTAILSGANTYNGTTTITAGTLQLGNGGTTGSLSPSSAIVNNGTFAINRSNAVTQGTDFSGAAITGTGGFTQAGAGGTTTLNNTTNSYSGLTLVSAGTLVLNGANSSAGNTQVGSGSGCTLSLGTGTNNGLASGTITFNNGFIQSSDANARSITNVIAFSSSVPYINTSGTGALIFTDTSTVNLSSATGKSVIFKIENTGSTTFAQSFANGSVNGDISNIGAGTLVLTGNSTYTGITTITAGTLSVGSIGNGGVAGNIGQATSAAGNLVFNGGTLLYTGASAVSDRAFTINAGKTATINTANDLTLAGATGAATTGVLQKTGTGTLTLTGANTYTGATTVNAGTLLLDMTTGSLDSTSALTLGGGNFQVKGKTGAFTTAQTLGALTLTADTGSTITLDPNGGTSTILTLGNSWTRGSGASLLIDYSSANTGTRQVVTAGATTGLTLSNGIYGTILVKDAAGVTGFATRSASAGTQPITRYDDRDTGAGGLGTILATTSNSGIINYTTLNSTYSSGTLSWSSGITTRSVNSLTIDTTNTGGTIDMGASSNILTLSGAAILFRGANNAILQGGQVNANFVVHQTGAGTLTINSLISGATKLVKDGTGTLVLGNSNTNTGAIIINAGTLKLGAAGSGANTPLGTIAGSTTVTGTGAALDLGGFTLATAEPLTLKGTGIAGGGALMNSGSAATYSGLITLGSDASIVANNDITLSATGTITGSGFGLTLDGTATGSSLASIIGTGAGTLTKSGTGTWTLSGTNTYTGATMINEGTLVGVVGGSCSNSAVTVANARALGVNITDITNQWTCASVALNNDSQLKFICTVTPSPTLAPLNILGNLTFSGTPTIVVSPRTTTPGKYPLLTVGGTAPTSSLPTLSPDGVNGRLVWEGKTLWVTIVPTGTLISFF